METAITNNVLCFPDQCSSESLNPLCWQAGFSSPVFRKEKRKGAQGQTTTNWVFSISLPNLPEILFHPHRDIEIIFTSAAVNIEHL